LRDCTAIVQFARTGKVTERVDVGADMASECHSFGSRASTYCSEELAVFLDEAEQIGWVDGVVGHADKIRLREIVGLCGLKLMEEIGSHAHENTLGCRSEARNRTWWR
jgi:hypothetical protein